MNVQTPTFHGRRSHRASRIGWRLVTAATFAAAISLLMVSCSGGSPAAPQQQPQPQAALSGVPLVGGSVVGGNTANGNVTLTAAAPAGGAVVALSSSNTSIATVPSNVTVPAGSASVGYTVTTNAVATVTPVTITGTYLGVMQAATLTVTPAATTTVRADFTVTPDAGTTAPAGQCSVVKTTSGPTMNILKCVFDASSSLPNPGITSYSWRFPGATSTVSGVTVTDPMVPCGTFSGAAQRDVMLTIVAPQGSGSAGKTIVFVKGAEC